MGRAWKIDKQRADHLYFSEINCNDKSNLEMLIQMLFIVSFVTIICNNSERHTHCISVIFLRGNGLSRYQMVKYTRLLGCEWDLTNQDRNQYHAFLTE
jgi:hypothetical protein